MERWPGCYVPHIPEKKTASVDISKGNPLQWSVKGNKEGEFVEERRSLLERFLRELAKFKFLINSSEFAIFARRQGEVDKALDVLPKQTPGQILEKYRQTFTMVNES